MYRSLAVMAVVFAAGSTSFSQEARPKPNASGPAAQPDRPRPGPERMVTMLLQQMDENKDGKIAKSEARNRVADIFATADVNKDGYLDRNELMAIAQRMANAIDRPGGPRPGGPFGRGADPLDFDAQDKNADGRLTRDELRGSRFADVFDAIDKNKDGKLNPDEWSSYHNAKK